MLPHCNYVHTDKTNGAKTPCLHQTYRGQLCVFHATNVREKAKDFERALGAILDEAYASADPIDLNFKGFVFPRVDFRYTEFRGIADFRKTIFTDDADFRGALFRRPVDFHVAEFRKNAVFDSAKFENIARFAGVQFKGRAIFSSTKFRGRTVFHGCRFSDFAAWQGAKFDKPLTFQVNTFDHDADFRRATFFGGVNFERTLFNRRSHFEGTRFHGEVLLTQTHIAVLKQFVSSHVNMDGAVLHTADFWDNERLSHYSFRDAFLISVNLAGKELENCDFTGAVFKSVLTQGWKPDARTRRNTKFIYTDYQTEEVKWLDGGMRRAYTPVLESRVPAEGNFGEGEHANFTFVDYLREPIRMNIALNVPPILRSVVTSYLQIFTDYLQVTDGVSVELRTRLEGSQLRAEFFAKRNSDLPLIREAFSNYQRNIGLSIDEIKRNIPFRENTTRLERDLFLMKMESEVNVLQTELGYIKGPLAQSPGDRELISRIVEASKSPGVLFEPLSIAPETPDAYVSYAWGDDASEEGLHREQIVDLLCDTITSSGRKVGRDKDRMRSGDSIERFALEITRAPCIIAVISEKYLHSEFCMVRELFRAYQRYQYKLDEFQKKVIGLVLDDAKMILQDHDAVLSLAEEWKERHDRLRRKQEKVDPLRKSRLEWEFLNLMDGMIPRISDMLLAINDILMKRGFDEIVSDGFKEVLKRLPPR